MAESKANFDDGIGPLLSSDRPAPHNLDAEKALLGAMITDPNIIPDCTSRLDVKTAFFSPAHTLIFQALKSMTSADDSKQAVDLVTISNYLKSKNELESAGDSAYIGELMNMIPTAANYEHYLDIVNNYATLRKLIRLSATIIGSCYTGDQDVGDLLENVHKEILDISTANVGKKDPALKDVVKMAIEYIVQLESNEDCTNAIDTGFTDLDYLFTGMKPGELYILAARPSIGKTAFAMNIACNVALRGQKLPVGVFSLEMSTLQLVVRLLSSEAKLNIRDVKDGAMDAKHWDEVGKVAEKLSNAGIYIDDNADITVSSVRAKARKMKDEYNIQFLVVDYLQLLKAEGDSKNLNRENQVAQMSRGLKGIAKELGIPIMVLAQLNREAENAGQKPRLNHLRESGAIEQDADVVMLLHRERQTEATPEAIQDGLDAELIIAKNRNGATGLVPLLFFQSYTQFQNKSKIANEDVPINEF